ncbi:MAG TPA: SAM-dependent methyltransferase [Actinomadura sp.]|nr:SAM-dependent methyltransferase [Actinomadura sp.]
MSDLPEVARPNRAFLQRAVQSLAEAGIRQFVDADLRATTDRQHPSRRS